jgi:hypothetical protein
LYGVRVLLWINGPFGGGKTQTAHELQRRLPGAVVCDPELAGFGLQRMIPRGLRPDFQDLPAWRQGVYEVLDLVLAKHDGPVIAPMTIIEPAYFQQIIGRLRDGGHEVHHFALLAERDTVLRRLSERVLGRAVHVLMGQAAALRRESFAVSKLDLSLQRLQEPEFAEQLWTDHQTVPEVAEHIAARTGLTIAPNADDPLTARLRRAWIGLKHIRMG